MNSHDGRKYSRSRRRNNSVMSTMSYLATPWRSCSSCHQYPEIDITQCDGIAYHLPCCPYVSLCFSYNASAETTADKKAEYRLTVMLLIFKLCLCFSWCDPEDDVEGDTEKDPEEDTEHNTDEDTEEYAED